jgi:hypothetical protein
VTRIIYGKIAKSTSLDAAKWGARGGDNEPLYLLLKLARKHPDVEWVFGTRYRAGTTSGLPDNVTIPPLPKRADDHEEWYEILWPFFEQADGVLLWLAAHGEVNRSGFPLLDLKSTAKIRPKDEAKVWPILRCINRWREPDPLAREEVWLAPDTRIILKARDLKWPPRHPIISQYPRTENRRHFRYGDLRTPEECGFKGEFDRATDTWKVQHHYTVDGLEIVGIPEDWNHGRDFADRVPFRILTNETKTGTELDKANLLSEWTPGLSEGNLGGSWSAEGAAKVGVAVPRPVPFVDIPDFLGGAKSTFVTPTSGVGWPTLKMHEAFVLGTVCFFHPRADDLGSVVPTLEQIPSVADPDLKSIAEWLRPATPEALAQRVREVNESRETYEQLRDAQLRLEARFVSEERAVRTIEQRLGLALA